MSELIAAVRIRGKRNMKPKLRRTLEMLRLERPNHCVVLTPTPQTMGMVSLVKDFVAFGNVSEQTVQLLLRKRGEKGSKSLSEIMKDDQIKDAAKQIAGGRKVSEFTDPVFRLHPPKGGLKNLKLAYPLGDLGKRDDMDSLIRRMV